MRKLEPREQSKPTKAPWKARLFGVAVVAAVFPYGWLGKVYRPFGKWMDARFYTELSHHVGHSVVFGAIAALLLVVAPGLRRRYGLFLLCIVAIAVVQEGLQLMFKNRLVAWNDGKDVVVDVIAATVVFAVARAIGGIWNWRAETARACKGVTSP